MTVVTRAPRAPSAEMPPLGADAPQRFLFESADWALYEQMRERLSGRHVFVTYYKGKLELVTTSLLHEMVVGLVAMMIRVLAEETRTPLKGAGTVTLRREDLDEGTQADSSFYTVNEAKMRGKQKLDLKVDPPPDLAVEVEITKRLGERKNIYREIGVPELWVYGVGRLTILVRQAEDYQVVDRSPTFPHLSPQELFGFIANGLNEDESKWVADFRARVREALAKS
jgi:Uma2 family endonuclease